jgi:hypothetical protein
VDLANYLFRLWVHEAEDGLLPEVSITAESKMEAAALALRHFIDLGRPFRPHSYLQCEPHDGEGLRVADVLPHLSEADSLSGRHQPVPFAQDEAAAADFAAAEKQTLSSLRL